MMSDVRSLGTNVDADNVSKGKVSVRQAGEKFLAHDNFQYAKLKDFSYVQKIGQGAFGKVLLVQHRQTNTMLAMKMIKKSAVIKVKRIGQIAAEKKILSRCNHPMLVHMLYCIKENCYVMFVMPYMPCGDLYKYKLKAKIFPEVETAFIAAQVFLGVEYLHSLDTIYRDLKPENTLICSNGYIKLSDFGFTKDISRGRTYTLCGTPEYLPPEIIGAKGYGKSCDWWTFGIMLYELSTGNVPFRDDGNLIRLYAKITKGRYTQNPTHSVKLSNLINGLLQVDPSFRLGCLKGGARDIKNHPFFENIDFYALYKQEMPSPSKECTVDVGKMYGNIVYSDSVTLSLNKREVEYEQEFIDI